MYRCGSLPKRQWCSIWGGRRITLVFSQVAGARDLSCGSRGWTPYLLMILHDRILTVTWLHGRDKAFAVRVHDLKPDPPSGVHKNRADNPRQQYLWGLRSEARAHDLQLSSPSGMPEGSSPSSNCTRTGLTGTRPSSKRAQSESFSSFRRTGGV